MRAGTTSRDERREAIGDFLLRRLREVGLSQVFGVAGDYNLEFLEQLEATPGLKWVGCCNELNASYAADGCARTHGLSALVTTYGVGELSALCGVAGAYSEHVPVIAITGAPPLASIERRSLLHHTGGDGNFENMLACAREFSVAQARITPQNAVSAIDGCLRACILEKRPVYIQLPADLSYIKIETPAEPLRVEFRSNPDILDDFLDAALPKISSAQRPAILADADVARFGQQRTVRAIADKLGCPIAVMGTAKGVIDENDPHFIGLYAGTFSKAEARQAIENADCLIQLGVRFIDSTTGSFSERIPPDGVEINAWTSRVNGDDFHGVCMPAVLEGVLACTEARETSRMMRVTNAPKALPPQSSISQDWFWNRMEHFASEGDILVAENGTSLSGLAGIHLPADCSVICQALWGAIGYALPATLGSMLAAPDRRHLLFMGDGSFQLTAQELSSFLRHRLAPIIFLLNNDGYTIERLILGENSSYNDIQPWKYADLCGVFANGAAYESRRVTSTDELEEALQAASNSRQCFFIEVMLGRMDAPQSLRELGPIYARQDYGRRRTGQSITAGE